MIFFSISSYIFARFQMLLLGLRCVPFFPPPSLSRYCPETFPGTRATCRATNTPKVGWSCPPSFSLSDALLLLYGRHDNLRESDDRIPRQQGFRRAGRDQVGMSGRGVTEPTVHPRPPSAGASESRTLCVRRTIVRSPTIPRISGDLSSLPQGAFVRLT